MMTSSQREKTSVDAERRAQALTPEDVDAIANALENRLVKRLYLGVGEGVLSLAWKAVIVGILALAGYGMATGKFH